MKKGGEGPDLFPEKMRGEKMEGDLEVGFQLSAPGGIDVEARRKKVRRRWFDGDRPTALVSESFRWRLREEKRRGEVWRVSQKMESRRRGGKMGERSERRWWSHWSVVMFCQSTRAVVDGCEGFWWLPGNDECWWCFFWLLSAARGEEERKG
ncbi:hypothetical protein HAX54_023630 [Datura stramonium]|uniref:Uncharacterized protein n=1 Tax=Datura stramonium TaxID=4076 RepID=A0ABS8S568_DATST|nr:hypothetical protein [Datura stramonium]